MTVQAAPAIKPIPNLILPQHELHYLSNGIPVYSFSAGTQEVLKIECIFDAGKSYESQHQIAKITAALLTEGTKGFSSAELAEKTDFYGATLSSRGGVDTARIRLYCMNKHLEKVLPCLFEVMYFPTFPQEELDFYIEDKIEKLELDLTKNENIAYRLLTEVIFGTEHPYGYNPQIEDLKKARKDLLEEHHKTHYRTDNVKIFVSGKLKPDTLPLLDKYLGQYQKTGLAVKTEFNIVSSQERKIVVKGPQRHQAAIRIGRPLFGRGHADFPGMYVMNTLLGGYFGSRLNTNLREEKGYTYGIYSSVDTFQRGGCFYISTEVGTNKMKKSLAEIYHEIERLQSEEVNKEELDMVQNYLLGFLMSQMDGPFNSMDMIKSLLLEAGETSYFELLIRKIKTTTPRDIKLLAQKYLKREDLIEIVVTA